MKRFIKPLKTTKAEGYIDTVVCVIAAMMVIVLALNVFSFLTFKQDMDHFAKELIDTATTYGRTNEQVTDRYKELCAELGISPTVSFSGTTYYNATAKKVQLGETIRVTLTYKTYVRGLGVLKIPVTLRASFSGLSQKYWK
jgi:hypothetical protein